MYSGIKARLLDNKKLLTGKATAEEKKEALDWAAMTHNALREFTYNSGIELPRAVLNALEDRMIELSQARTKIQSTM